MSRIVWTISESQVYHSTPNCSALTRSNAYYSPWKTSLDHRRARSRRPCKFCHPGGRR